uniref:C-type lectin domain-containing protein n=1 Tax=Salarias fasciatus TaxID=181472 RepID=A0A672FKW1_SALFA
MCKRPLSSEFPPRPGSLLTASFSGSCYWMVSNRNMMTTWPEAFTKCSDLGAHLLIINSQEEEEFLSTYSKGTSKWIGLQHYPTEGGGFDSHVDGTPLSHTNWADGEPNNHEGREECVEMVSSPSGTYSWWNDLNCDAHQDWICKIVKGKEPVEPRVAPTPLPGTAALLFTSRRKGSNRARRTCSGKQVPLQLHSSSVSLLLSDFQDISSLVGLVPVLFQNSFR